MLFNKKYNSLDVDCRFISKNISNDKKTKLIFKKKDLKIIEKWILSFRETMPFYTINNEEVFFDAKNFESGAIKKIALPQDTIKTILEENITIIPFDPTDSNCYI